MEHKVHYESQRTQRVSVLRGHLCALCSLFFIMLEVNAQSDTTLQDGPYALIAGGSKGIGYGLAEALAKRHYNLVLIARHWDSLNAAKHKLESQYGVHVELLSYDLSKESSAQEISQWC